MNMLFQTQQEFIQTENQFIYCTETTFIFIHSSHWSFYPEAADCWIYAVISIDPYIIDQVIYDVCMCTHGTLDNEMLKEMTDWFQHFEWLWDDELHMTDSYTKWFWSITIVFSLR